MIRSILFTSLLFTFFIVGCKSKTQNKELPIGVSKVSRQDKQINNYWKWFEANENKLQNFQQNPDKILTEVLDSARKIESGLAIEFEPPKNNIINVTISADGDRNLFPIVQNIVDKAPQIKGWNFIAFRQRIPKEKVKSLALKIQGQELNLDKLKFFPSSVWRYIRHNCLWK